jgi:hypothetical protein
LRVGARLLDVSVVMRAVRSQGSVDRMEVYGFDPLSFSSRFISRRSGILLLLLFWIFYFRLAGDASRFPLPADASGWSSKSREPRWTRNRQHQNRTNIYRICTRSSPWIPNQATFFTAFKDKRVPGTGTRSLPAAIVCARRRCDKYGLASVP